MSYFAHRSAARRYAVARPFFHPVVLERIREHLGAIFPLKRALDVACGTGQSTRILSELARVVVGTDVSIWMLDHAESGDNIRYAQARAEGHPFLGASFDLITVALAFHWFERNSFLSEAHRVLRPGGWLVIYDNALLAEMQEDPEFRTWFVDRYIARYPSPPRDRTPLTDDDARSFGFEVTLRETDRNTIRFDRQQLIDYLMTQSNIIVTIEDGAKDPRSVHQWLNGELSPFLSDKPGTFLFGGPITYLHRVI